MTEVWQIDREAAADLIQWQRDVGTSDEVVHELRAGKRDNSGTIEAFAKHREAAMKAMREAIEKKLDECGEPCPQCRDNVAAIEIKETSNV